MWLEGIRANLFLCLDKDHVTKTYGYVEVQIHVFLISVVQYLVES